MKIGIANDHAGVEYKNKLVEYLTGKGYEMVNFGTDTTDSMDYPDVAHPLASAVENGEVDLSLAKKEAEKEESQRQPVAINQTKSAEELFRSEYTFENFVVGSSNKFANSAAV